MLTQFLGQALRLGWPKMLNNELSDLESGLMKEDGIKY